MGIGMGDSGLRLKSTNLKTWFAQSHGYLRYAIHCCKSNWYDRPGFTEFSFTPRPINSTYRSLLWMNTIGPHAVRGRGITLVRKVAPQGGRKREGFYMFFLALKSWRCFLRSSHLIQLTMSSNRCVVKLLALAVRFLGMLVKPSFP